MGLSLSILHLCRSFLCLSHTGCMHGTKNVTTRTRFLFHWLIHELTAGMLMELVSHEALLLNTSGPLLLVYMKLMGSQVMVHLQQLCYWEHYWKPSSLICGPELLLWVSINGGGFHPDIMYSYIPGGGVSLAMSWESSSPQIREWRLYQLLWDWINYQCGFLSDDDDDDKITKSPFMFQKSVPMSHK